MSATKEAPEKIESPGYGFGPNELPFYPHDGRIMLEAVVAAIWSSLDQPAAQYADTAAGDFIGLLTQAAQRLDREAREAGFGVEEDALRGALQHVQQAELALERTAWPVEGGA